MNAVLSYFSDLSMQHQNPKCSLDYSYGPFDLEYMDTVSLQAGLGSLTHLKLRTASTGFRTVLMPALDNLVEGGGVYPNWLLNSWISAVSSFTTKAKNLVSLELQFKSGFKRFSRDLMLPKLKRLSLRRARFDKPDALEFLKRHSATLVSLSLSGSMLRDYPDRTPLWAFFKELQSEMSLRSLEISPFLRNGPEFGDVWPTTIPPERSIRYLVSGQKTNMAGELDTVSRYPFQWDKITWSSVQADYHRVVTRWRPKAA